MMSIAELTQLMLKHGLVIRAINPHDQTAVYDPRHKDQFPEGVVRYSEECKRDMLHVSYRNSQGGKFVITSDSGQGSTVHWASGTVFYDSIEDAVKSFIKDM